MKRILLFTALFLVGWISTTHAQTNPAFYEYPQNHLDWYTVESEHFMIHFQEGNSTTAQVVSRIAEEVYGPITELYQHEPDTKVSIVLKDREDYSNGAAYFFDNKIDIWVPSLDSPLRGTHNWMRNVIAHEFTHIVQIQVTMKRKRSFPVLYFQWLSYENVRRPDVLYGFPNGIVSMPFASINVPAWLAEGTAQYQRADMQYDTWDSHRDMIMRTRILSDTYFTLAEMGTFSSKTSLERETVYNQGFAFVIYLGRRFGDDVLRRISEALAQKKVYTVEEAIQIATNIPGNEVFNDWVAERKSFYKAGIQGMEFTKSEYVESEGFFNFYPRISPDGKTIAYLSNKGFDYSLLFLYLNSEEGDEQISLIDHLEFQEPHNHADAVKPAIPFVSTAFSFSPDGKKLAYVVNKKNAYGEEYRDLFTFDLATKKSTRLTKSARIESPNWGPNGLIAAVQYTVGTQNLVLLDPANPDSIRQLTDFTHAETVFTPTWHPDSTHIYFAFADVGARSIRSYNLETDKFENVLGTGNIDYRDPTFSSDGATLYFSSNPDGIFNIYSKELSSEFSTKLTQVLGGAFMPQINGQDLYFAEYEKEGYKLKKSNISVLGVNVAPVYTAAETPLSNETFENAAALMNYDDKDIQPFDAMATSIADTGSYVFELATIGQPDKREYRAYTDTFLDYAFYPVLRFDNYTKLHGNNGTLIKNGQLGDVGKNLIRDVKPGLYFFNRDVIDKLSIFGGLMLGVGSKSADGIGDYFSPSNLFSLDRDLFFTAEYRGLPFIKKSWSPTISVELYNLHRNVKDGLSIEEFPCTSCLPDTSSVDIGYEVWEAYLYFRSKLSRRSLLELGIGYSPYQVTTDNFYSRELKGLVSGSSSEYFKGTTFSAAYTFDYYMYSIDADIAPIGLKGYLRYQYQPSKLLEEYEIKDGSLVPLFKTSRNHSTEIHVRYGFKTFGNQAFQARIRGFTYFNDPKDSFYTDYVGGFLGMRSYPFYAIAGNTTAFTSLSWFVPIFKNMHRQAGPFMFDKMYARFFFETGNGWFLGDSNASETADRLGTGNNLKKGIGAELRLASNGYYLFPLKFFVSATYGFDEFNVSLPDAFVTGTSSNRVTYGREVLFHFGLTFDFELL